MNNLLLSLFLVSSGTVVLMSQHLTVQNARTASRKLTADGAQAKLKVDQATLVLNEAHAALTERRQEFNQAAAAASAKRKAGRTALPKLVDPAGEGVWPADKPYFYLPKTRLGALDFQAFSAEETSAPQAGMVLGLLSEEKAAVDQALESYYERLHQLQVTHAQHQYAAPGVNTENHQETTYRIPAMRAETEALGEELRTAWQSVLGAARTQLLWDRFPHGPTWPTGDSDSLVTYFADRKDDGTVAHFIKVTQGVGGIDGGVSFPDTPGTVLWHWRHLFGEKPLIPLPVNAPAAAPQSAADAQGPQ